MTAGGAAERLIQRRLAELGQVAGTLGVAPDAVVERVIGLRRELREAERQVERLRDEVRIASVRGSRNGGPARRDAKVPLILETVEADGMNDLRGWADRYLEVLGGSGVVGVANQAIFAIKVSRDLAAEHPAKRLARLLGEGGGSDEMAQGRLTKPPLEAFQELEASLK
jgi:alanyl-tRNA synthetase